MSSITKPTRAQVAFMEAPDAKPEKPRPRRRPPAARVQISLKVAADVLRQLDEMAGRYGQTRAGLIGIGIARVLRDGL
jgi:uncharacterized protein (DUF4415 family)